MLDLNKKIVLVTGASRGIGKATALAFAAKGAVVVIHYNTYLEGAQGVLDQIITEGGAGIIVQADMRDRAQIDAMFATVLEQCGTLDILINNAGGIGPYADYRDVNFTEVDEVLATNLVGPMYCSQLALKHFRQEDKKGVILSTSSIHDRKVGGEEKALAYCVSKAGLSHMTQILARSAAPKVRVNAVSPGPVLTEIWQNDTQETKDYFSQRCLIQRRIEPEEIAHSFIFLAENESITGTVLYVDGGFRA